MADSVLFDVNSPSTTPAATKNDYYATSNSNKDDLQFYNTYGQHQQQRSPYEPSSYYCPPPPPSGDMNMNGATAYPESTMGFWSAFGTTGFPGEPPLLEELGMNFYHIKDKSLMVLNPIRSIPPSIMDDTDLGGPLAYLFLYGLALMLSGKVHFGYVYGVGVIGVGSIYVLLNMMSQHVDGVDWSLTASVLGYCLLPMVMLSGISIVLQLGGIVGLALTVISIVWCTLSSSAMFTSVLHMHDQRLLVMYPLVLFYSCFALMAVF